ncbi:MAG: TrkH family potassium uptake protein [Rikenellaceae bacterium]
MRLYVVMRYIGLVMLYLALAMAASAIVAYVSYRDTSFYALLLSALLTALMGVFPLIFVKSESQISNKEGYCIVLGSWLLACVVTMFPYLLWGGEFCFADAWFESVSGLTTTGASILTNIEALPRGLLFWRMLSTWIGGIGVIMFALVTLPSIGRSRMTLSNMELSSIAKDNYHYRTQVIARIIMVVYFGLTMITTVLLKLAGMNWYDALTHSMSASATSGFSTKNSSVAYFDSALIEMILVFAMIAAGTHFGLIYATVTGKYNNLFRSEVQRFYVGVIVVCSFLVAINLYFSGVYPSAMTSMRHALFQFVSLITTTGYATVDTNFWPPFAIVILIFGSICCASAGSTTGGLKVNRILIAFKIFKLSFKQQQHPNAIFRVKVDGVTQDFNILYAVVTFIVLYFVFILSGTLMGTILGLDVMTSFSASFASLGNVGPGFGEVGSMDNYSQLPDVFKYYLTFLMLLGRLEIFGLIQLFMIKWWR